MWSSFSIHNEIGVECDQHAFGSIFSGDEGNQMSFVLIANFGNSDLRLTDESPLPQPPPGGAWTIRQKGEEISNNLRRYAAGLELPLLAPTLRWLLARHEIDANTRIYLFASDQPAEISPEEERQKDTKPMAEAARALLVDAAQTRRLLGKPSNLAMKQIRIHAIEGNPADYANALAFYTERLPEIAHHVQVDQPVYLEVSGGTPAMTAMLIVAGVESFGQRARTLYLARNATTPYEVAVAHELFARRARATMQTQVRMYAYAVALRTMKESGGLFVRDEQRRESATMLLQYADRRLAFDFTAARESLEAARRLSVGNDQARIEFWMSQMSNAGIAFKLEELIHSLRIKAEFGDYADLVQRLFRFQEAAFRYMAEQMGLRYAKPDTDEYIHREWFEGKADLVQFLQDYASPFDGEPIAIDVARSLNRISLGAIVDYFVTNEAAWHRWRASAEALHSLSKVADLRNKGLAGHGFRGIGKQDVENAFGGPYEKMVETLVAIFASLFGRSPQTSPYDAVNELVLRLVAPGERHMSSR
jgi:hypothetical protein